MNKLSMVTQTQTQYYTPEKYLVFEENVEYKHEYRDGKIIPMTGGTTNHNKIAGNFYSYLRFNLKGKNYETYIRDVRLWIGQYHLYTYPDIMVIYDQPTYEGKGTTTVTNPCLIGEVLSKSTQNYDQGEKFRFYRSLPTFQEYFLLSQEQQLIMQYTKTREGNWLLQEYENETSMIQLKSLALEMNLTDFYEGINFTQTEK